MSTVIPSHVRNQPDSTEGHAASAALHAVRPRPTAAGGANDTGRAAGTGGTTDTSGYPDPSKLSSADQETASAGAAASLAYAGYTAREINEVETEHPLRNPQLCTTSYQAASLAGRVQTSRNTKTMDGKALDHKGEVPKDSEGARLAATGAFSKSRKRSESAPTPLDNPISTYSLTAATTCHRVFSGPKTVLGESEPAFDLRQIHEAALGNARRELHIQADTQHVEAMTVARQMFSVMPRVEAAVSSITSHHQEPTTFARRSSLYETAQKLASERLSQMHNEQKAPRGYYHAAHVLRRSTSMYAKLRKRASSESSDTDMGEELSTRIRSQMTDFHHKMANVDTEKMAWDHESLMRTAKKNADAVIDDVDQHIYETTGRPPSRMLEKFSMINGGTDDVVTIGTGKSVKEGEVDRAVRSKAKQTIDDIMERIEEQRARCLEEELDEREALRQHQLEKERRESMKKTVQYEEDDERKFMRDEKERKTLLNRISRNSGASMFRRKSAKARGKARATEELPAPGALTNGTTAQSDEEEVIGMTSASQQQNSPFISHMVTCSAGESSRSILLEPHFRGLSHQSSRSSNRTQSSASENASSTLKLFPRDVKPSQDQDRNVLKMTDKVADNRLASGEGPERRKSAPAVATEGPQVNGPLDTDGRHRPPAARPVARQWSSTTETSREVTERKDGESRVLSRRSFRKRNFHIRLFSRSSWKSGSEAAPGSFEVQREHTLVQATTATTNFPPPAAGAASEPEGTPEALKATSRQSSVTNTSGNQSKFTENL
ncbi:hypothetical protein PAAG_00905 [Paracoccidioides lutzii Pb01]|uniref:Uncharacterized protein n=1 Tax=Paracoccidioides lutzii (strain ATCC MYA-826 / Pb01) TaxID=502779 RepID=C1GQW0_PARBA|nr:hypothetical protein PAAG_00905 [Paracoccidioides lutzii Pb01]EEH37984.2 hypothetical protein PAAG_00905 [Paracoccidioides lutzii Pb01]